MNRLIDNDEFGDGWWLSSLDLVYETLDGVGLVDAAGMVVFFPEVSTETYDVQDHDERFIESFVKNVDDTYTLTYVNGGVSEFDTSGRLTSRADANSNETTYGYTGSHVTTITDESSGRETTLAYDGTTGLIESITDFASRSTLFEHTGTRLTGVAFPAPDAVTATPEMSFAYATSGDNIGLLTQVTDVRGFDADFVYDDFRRMFSTEQPTPDESSTFLTYLTSVQSSAASQVGANPIGPREGSSTDGINDYLYQTDRFGNHTSWALDDEGTETTFYGKVYDARGRLEEFIQPDPDGAGPRGEEHTLYTYDTTYLDKVIERRHIVGENDLTSQETDDIVYAWEYGTNGVMTSYTDPEGRVTTYDLDANGNALAMTQEGNLGTTADDLATRWTYTTGGAGSGIPAGLVASKTTPNGETTYFEYFAAAEGLHRAGRLKRVVYADTVPLEEVTPVSSARIDNGAAGYSDTGDWATGGLGYESDNRYVSDPEIPWLSLARLLPSPRHRQLVGVDDHRRALAGQCVDLREHQHHALDES
ncbi:MAG: RHS repeat protein [Planctomycetes bacterium]|nr:RHS repeat protein [Planctomycetota bacterium]